MTIVLVIFSVLVGLIAALLFVASRRPDSFLVERRIHIGAPPSRVIEFIDDFHRWEEWSPWEGLDPNMKRTYTGAERGVGAQYAWIGSSKVGQGKMAIREVDSPRRVVIALDFLKPFEAHNTTEFTLRAIGETTEVTWVMSGPQPLIGKVMGLIMNMDKLVGKDFDKGLATLKARAEQ